MINARFGVYPIDDHIIDTAIRMKRILNANLKVNSGLACDPHKGDHNPTYQASVDTLAKANLARHASIA